jgi:prevent-host-death family protein
MQTVNLYDAKNRFSKLVDAAADGEIIVIARNGKPAVKLVPLNYGERTAWSGTVHQFIREGQREGQYDEAAFTIDRSDLPAPSEQDVF